MAEKKVVKKTKSKVKATKSKVNVTASKAKATKSKVKKLKEEQSEDMGIVIVDDDITVDQEKVNEERRAYLEESRSQDAYD